MNTIDNVLELDYEDIVQKIGFGRTQWILLLLSGLLTISSMAAQLNVTIISIASQCEFNMSQADKGIMLAACVTGITISTYFWGYLSDALGRRFVLLWSTFVSTLLQLISFFITTVWLFNLINFITGVSFGGVTAALYAYLAEFNTDKHRPIVINYSTMFVSITTIYVPATAWLAISSDWSWNIFGDTELHSWRLLILFSLLPGFIGALVLLLFPESPKFLLAQGKEKEAIAGIEWMCQFNRKTSLIAVIGNDDFKLKLEEQEVEINNSGIWNILISIWKATLPLLNKPYGKNFIYCALAVLGLFFISSMANWFPEIVNRSYNVISNHNETESNAICAILDKSFATAANTTNDSDAMKCDDSITTRTYIDNMIVGAANLTGFIVQGFLLNALGRRMCLFGSIGITAICIFLLYFITNPVMVLILFCLFIVMPSLAISVMCGVAIDIIPTHLRAKAVSVCFTLGRLGIVVALNFIGLMLDTHCRLMFGIFIGVALICILLIRRLPV